MTFFEQELRKIVGPVCSNAKYIGRAAFVPLGGDNVAKFEYITQGVADRYTALRAQAVSKVEGVLDTTAIRFGDSFSKKPLPMDSPPFAWTCDGKTEWYGFTPTRSDYAALTEAVSNYVELFSQQTQRMEAGSMSLTM